MTDHQALDDLRSQLNPPNPATSPSLMEMNQLAADIVILRDQEKAAAEVKSEISGRLEAKEQRVIELLMGNGLTSYKAPEGLLSMSFRLSAKLPVGDARQQFFDYLKREGKFDDLVSVSSQTYCSYIKEQYDLAREAGRDEPVIPGVLDVKATPRLSFRRAR